MKMQDRLKKELWLFAFVVIIALSINALIYFALDTTISGYVINFLIMYVVCRFGYNLGYNECYYERYMQGLEDGMNGMLTQIKMFFLECKHGDLYKLFLEYSYQSTTNNEEDDDKLVAEKFEEKLNNKESD